MDESHRQNDQLNQRQKAPYYIIPFIWSSRTSNIKTQYLKVRLLALPICMQVGYFIREEHECIRNVLYLDPGDDFPGKNFLMLKFTSCMLEICTLYCMCISTKTSVSKGPNVWRYPTYDTRHQYRGPRNPVEHL